MAKGFNSRGMGGFGGGMNMNMMKQVQKMQQDMMKMQQELETKTYTAGAEGGRHCPRGGGPGGRGDASGHDRGCGERGFAGSGERLRLHHAAAHRRARPAVLSRTQGDGPKARP